MKKHIAQIGIYALLSLSIISCKKSAVTSSPEMKVMATSTEARAAATDPSDTTSDSARCWHGITAINIDVKSIVVKYRTEKDSAFLLDHPIQLNLLDLKPDSFTFLAQAFVKLGGIKEVRLILGPNNFVIKNGVRYDLKVPSACESGLKIKIHGEITQESFVEFVIDFNFRRSLVKTEDGTYLLKPVIKIKSIRGASCDNDDGEDDDTNQSKDE